MERQTCQTEGKQVLQKMAGSPPESGGQAPMCGESSESAAIRA